MSFTIPNAISNCYLLIAGGTYTSKPQVMLNEGNHPYPYSEYCGKILHTKDIEPVLLWSKADPSDIHMGGTTLTIDNSSNFKYLIIEYATTNRSYFKKVLNLPNSNYELDWNNFTSTGGDINSRSILIDSYTQVTVFENHSYHIGSNTMGVDNDYCVPINIYGTNIL